MWEIRVKSVIEYLEVIETITQRYECRKRELSFRGLSNYNHVLVPGIFRTFTVCKEDGTTRQLPQYGTASEYVILRHFIKSAMSHVNHIDKDDLLTWLTYAQHFGAPTRLLDFSSNPLISLYFACKRENGVDGAVCILYEKGYVNSLRLQSTRAPTKRAVLDEILRHIVDPAVECTPYPVTFIPHYIDSRMEAQASRFLVWGSNRAPFEDIATSHGSMLHNDPGAYFGKLIIDGAFKRRLMRDLSFLGMNDQNMFPGLDGVGKYIAEYYRQTVEDELSYASLS